MGWISWKGLIKGSKGSSGNQRLRQQSCHKCANPAIAGSRGFEAECEGIDKGQEHKDIRMAKKTSNSKKTVKTLTHDEASRKNIPTAEYQSVMAKEQQTTAEYLERELGWE